MLTRKANKKKHNQVIFSRIKIQFLDLKSCFLKTAFFFEIFFLNLHFDDCQNVKMFQNEK